MTRISTGTVSIGNGETIFTLWDGDDDVVLSEITAPAQSAVVIEGVANFIKTRLSTTSAELVLPHSGAGGAGLACAISALTPAETQIGTLNARTARVIQELETVEANGRGLFYRFSDTTTDADPGAGYLRFNQLDLTTATAAYIDVLDANGGTVSGEVDTWDDSTSLGKGNLWVRSVADPSAFRTYAVTGSVVDGTGYRKLTLTHIGGSGSFAADDELMVAFARTGDRGDGYITDDTVADPSELTALEGEDAGYLVFVTDLQTDFGAYSGRSGVVELIAGPDWELVAVYTGPQGVQGIQGIQGIQGERGINWQGDYNGATAYVEDDGVLYNGSSWRALGSTTGNAPPTLPTTSNAYWQLLARQGIDGAGTVNSVVAGTGIDVDNTDPTAPEVSLADMANATVKGRNTTGTGAPEDLTMAQLLTLLKVAGAFAKDNVLGTVSQSGGVPTGAVIESGSNANGNYIRFADGTQIVWGGAGDGVMTADNAVGSGYQGASLSSRTFPAAFSVAPFVSTFPLFFDSSPGRAWITVGSRTTTTVSLIAHAFTTGSQVFGTYIAIGRWF